MMRTWPGIRFGKRSIAWYLIAAVCVFPLLGAHVHAFNPHHASAPHPFDQELHSHQYAAHDTIDDAATPSHDDIVVELDGESVLQQVLKIFQYVALFALLLVVWSTKRITHFSRYVVPLWLYAPSRRPCQPRAPPAI